MGSQRFEREENCSKYGYQNRAHPAHLLCHFLRRVTGEKCPKTNNFLRDVQCTMYNVQVLIKIKETEENRKNAHFKFKIFFLKRPDLHPAFNPKWIDPYFADWTEPESDDDLEGPDEEIFSCVSVCLAVIQMDTLQKCSAFMLAKMKKSPEALIVGDKPLPKQILNLILSFISQDLCK